jgi:hypothetical protein
MTNIDHIMPKAVIVPIFWGHDYVANPATANTLGRLLTDLVTGPFLNGLAQYGVQRPSLLAPRIIDDTSPPTTITYTDANNKLTDEITKLLIKWINANLVPAPPSSTDINQLYFIFPPPETTPLKYNGASDPIGNGDQAWHNEGRTDPASPPTYYWAIVKTNDVGPASDAQNFVNNLAQKVCHELVEQLVDRDGSFEEVGDPCQCRGASYRGWSVQPYWSEWGNADDSSAWNKHCVNGDSPISLKQFLSEIGFDFKTKGLASLGTSVINIDYIALTMQSKESGKSAPSNCYGSPGLTVTARRNQSGYDVSYMGTGFPAKANVELALAGLAGFATTQLAVGAPAVADDNGNITGGFSFTCTSPFPSPNAALQVEDPSSLDVIVSTPVSFDCTP